MASNKLETSLEAVNGGDPAVIVTGKNPLFNYKDGKKVSEEPIGTTYTVALTGNRLSPLNVKILGEDPLPELLDEDIEEGVSRSDFRYVRFIGTKVSVYVINSSMHMTATATKIEIVE